MFFQIYGDNAGWQLLGWVLVFAGLVLANEFSRRSKQGGIVCSGIPTIPGCKCIHYNYIVVLRRIYGSKCKTYISKSNNAGNHGYISIGSERYVSCGYY